MMTAPDRRSRDARIRELDRLGWSSIRIAAEVDVTDARVRQILAEPGPDILLAKRRAEIEAELEELNRHREMNLRRIRAVRRELDRLDEEAEALSIDRLLGLA